MKKTLTVIGVIIAIILMLVLGMMFFIRGRISMPGSQRAALTGGLLQMPAGGLAVNPFEGSVDLKNITILNPPGFTDRVMASFREIFADLDTDSLSAPEKHFREVRISLNVVTLIRRKDGLYNYEPLFPHEKAERKAEEKAEKTRFRVKIDRLSVRIGHIIFMDYTVSGDKPMTVRFDVNMDETYTGVTDLAATGKQISSTLLGKITVGDIRNFEIKDLPDIARSAMDAIPDETKDRIFGAGEDRDRVLKELGKRLTGRITGIEN